MVRDHLDFLVVVEEVVEPQEYLILMKVDTPLLPVVVAVEVVDLEIIAALMVVKDKHSPPCRNPSLLVMVVLEKEQAATEGVAAVAVAVPSVSLVEDQQVRIIQVVVVEVEALTQEIIVMLPRLILSGKMMVTGMLT